MCLGVLVVGIYFLDKDVLLLVAYTIRRLILYEKTFCLGGYLEC